MISKTEHRQGAWPFWWRGLSVLFVAAILTHLAHEFGWLQGLDEVNTDWMVGAQKAAKDDSIFLIEINSNDYSGLFKATSPLKPETLACIINLVAESKPKAIGVDVDTTAWTTQERAEVRAGGVPIVWAVQPSFSPERSRQLTLRLPEASAGEMWAVPGLIPDPDGLIRKYYRQVPAITPPKVGKYDGTIYRSFVTALHDLANNASVPPLENRNRKDGEAIQSEELQGVINFTGTRFKGYSATNFKAFAEERNPVQDKARFPELTGKIVLIGGAFPEGRDMYPTSTGLLPGVEVVAHSLHSEREPIREATGSDLFRADLIFGTMLLTFNFFAIRQLSGMTKKAVLIGAEFVLLPATMFLLTWASFTIWRFYAGFLILVCGLFLHAFIEFHLEQRAEIRELKSQLRRQR